MIALQRNCDHQFNKCRLLLLLFSNLIFIVNANITYRINAYFVRARQLLHFYILNTIAAFIIKEAAVADWPRSKNLPTSISSDRAAPSLSSSLEVHGKYNNNHKANARGLTDNIALPYCNSSWLDHKVVKVHGGINLIALWTQENLFACTRSCGWFYRCQIDQLNRPLQLANKSTNRNEVMTNIDQLKIKVGVLEQWTNSHTE